MILCEAGFGVQHYLGRYFGNLDDCIPYVPRSIVAHKLE